MVRRTLLLNRIFVGGNKYYSTIILGASQLGATHTGARVRTNTILVRDGDEGNKTDGDNRIFKRFNLDL